MRVCIAANMFVPLWCFGLTTLLAFIGGRLSAGTFDRVPPSIKDVAPDVADHLYAPPPRHGEVAVPSVVRDSRGAVHNLKIGGFRFNVLVSSANTLRSGDVHRANQYDMIFSGKVRVTTRERGRDVEREYTAGELVVIPAHVPHIFTFLNDTVMAEWWYTDFETRYYKPYRAKVDSALHDAAGGGGSDETRAVAAMTRTNKHGRGKQRRRATRS